MQCRILGRKPVVPDVVTVDRSDADIAEDSWRNYLARNSSQIAETFGGQYKSHLVCNECGNTSVVFDPFTSVSVPIPVELWQPFDVYVFPEANLRPIRMKYWATDKNTAGDLARFICDRLAAIASPDYPLPAAPHELLISGSSSSPCMIRMTIPHTAPLRGSLVATKVS